MDVLDVLDVVVETVGTARKRSETALNDSKKWMCWWMWFLHPLMIPKNGCVGG